MDSRLSVTMLHLHRLSVFLSVSVCLHLSGWSVVQQPSPLSPVVVRGNGG